MKRSGLVLAVLVVFGAMVGWAANAPAASAATITVTTTADVVDAGDGVTSLREAITTANGNGQDDIIVLAPQTYSLDLCAAGEFFYDEAQDLTIEGNGATVVQTCVDQRILDKAGPNTTLLTVSDLTVVNTVNSGADIQGAVFRGESRMVFTNLTIDGINAGFNGTLLAVDDGPGIQFELELHDSSITNNTGNGVGNINQGGILVSGSTITGNTASAVTLGDGNPLTVESSVLADNGGFGMSTSGQGNGVQPVVTIADTTIANNALGGFQCLQSCRSVDVVDSFIVDNGHGGVPGLGGGLVVPIFSDNFPPLQSVTITNTTISGNHADHPGGGLWVLASGEVDGPDQPTITITDAIITDNHATCANCEGGGVALSVGNLVVDGSTIADNTAGSDGGGIAQRRAHYDVIVEPTVFSMTDTTVSGNTAGHNGGGLWIHSGTQTIDASTISDNTAANFGGGAELGGFLTNVFFDAGAATVTDTTISGNQAAYGGAVSVGFPDGSAVDMTNVTIEANTASTAGGAFAVGVTELLSVHHGTITDNAAPVGASFAASGSTQIEASIVAGAGGGGLHCEPFPFGPFGLNVSSLGYSWFDDDSCGPAMTDIVDLAGDPLLAALGANGGLTLTRLPQPVSPVIDLVPAIECGVAADQRGVARPGGPACDAGAVELPGDPPKRAEGPGRGDRLRGPKFTLRLRV